MQQSGVKKDKVLALGMLMLKKHPDMSRSLLSELEAEEPLDNNYNRIQDYFKVYTNLISVSGDQLRTRDNNRENRFHLKVFVATMIRIYQPLMPTMRGNVIKPGFSSSLGSVINILSPNITLMVKEVLVMERAYDDFRDEVDYTEYYLTQSIKPQLNGQDLQKENNRLSL